MTLTSSPPALDPEPPSNDSLGAILLSLGPKQDPLATAVPMSVVYSVLLVTGIIGNVCTCIVIARNRYMHTATNYYLFSLAVSDLLLLVLGLPQDLYQIWQRYPYIFGEAFCILRGFTSETSTNASILTITAFTIERYVAICHPLRAHTMSKLSRAVKFVVGIWLLSAACAVPVAVQFGVVYLEFGGMLVLESAQCTVKEPLKHAFELSTFLFFLLPTGVILVLYVCIALQLNRSNALSKRHKCPPLETNGKCSETDVAQSSDGTLQPPSKFQRGCQLRKSTKSSSASRKAVINMLRTILLRNLLWCAHAFCDNLRSAW